MVEAAIALPVLVVVLIGTGYMHRLYSSQHAAMSASRQSVWSYAQRGCKSDGGDALEVTGLRAADDAQASIAEITKSAAPVASSGAIKSLDDIPVVGALMGAVTPDRATQRSERIVSRPKLFPALDDPDREDDVIHAQTTVLCNEAPLSPAAVVLDTFKSLICRAAAALCSVVS